MDDQIATNSDVNLIENGSTCEAVLNKVKRGLKQVFTWKVLKPVLFGQGLSLLICGTAVTSEYLHQSGVSLPIFQSLLNYILLLIFYTTTLAIRKTENGKVVLFQVLRKHWWKYLILSIIDVEANYMVVLAYQYTSLTSVQLLDCFILPVVMVLSYFLLKVRFLAVHFVGVVISLMGVACMVGADILVGKGGDSGSNPALGDVLVLAGAVCYGITNVSMEYIAKRHETGRVEFLGMYGLFCPIVSAIQVAILERGTLASLNWNWTIVGLLAVFAICMFLLYSLLPVVMRLSSATAVNISLLTADLYALFAGLFLFQYKMSALYAVSFVTIVCALVIYNSKQPVSRTTNTSEIGESPLESPVEQTTSSFEKTCESSPLTEAKGTSFLGQQGE